jgi:hypothetical protein
MPSRQTLEEAREALGQALKGLEELRMVDSDDPRVVTLKDDIRRITQKIKDWPSE